MSGLDIDGRAAPIPRSGIRHCLENAALSPVYWCALYCTVSMTTVECDNVPDATVTVMVDVPAGVALGLALMPVLLLALLLDPQPAKPKPASRNTAPRAT
jgi:hypothetical protein